MGRPRCHELHIDSLYRGLRAAPRAASRWRPASCRSAPGNLATCRPHAADDLFGRTVEHGLPAGHANGGEHASGPLGSCAGDRTGRPAPVLDRTSGLGDDLRHHGHLIHQSPPQSLIARTSSAGHVRKSAIDADVGVASARDCSRASGTAVLNSHHTSHLALTLAVRPPSSTTPRRCHLAPLQRCEMTLTGRDDRPAVLRLSN